MKYAKNIILKNDKKYLIRNAVSDDVKERADREVYLCAVVDGHIVGVIIS